jgi:hypothetical protein
MKRIECPTCHDCLKVRDEDTLTVWDSTCACLHGRRS